MITATTVTAGNTGDAASAADLLAGDLPAPAADVAEAGVPEGDVPAGPDGADDDDGEEPLAVFGDAAYGAGELLDQLEKAGADIGCKVQPPAAPGGRFAKDAFGIDLQEGTVTCPAGQIAPLRPSGGARIASFGAACASCPLAAQCTTSRTGRTVTAGPYEEQLTRARSAQRDPDWKASYRATRPRVERKIGHLMRRRHGGRRARVRGTVKVTADFAMLATAVSLARLGVLGIASHNGTWAVNPS